MSLPRYPEYTDSGVAWLGKVPAHWAAHPLKHAIAKIESGVSVNAVDEPAESGGIGVLKTSCVYTGAFNPTENKAVLAEELSRVACPVRAGTLIVSRMNTPALVGAAGFVTESRDDLFLPDRLWQVHFREVANPAFVHYWTASPMYRAQVEMTCAGTSASMQNLSQDAFLAFTFPLPLPGEQVAIATFLDRETGKIDALIAEQEKLLALLIEKRQATISHAVTMGLNPEAPMKDSGMAWLGKVPEHWVETPIKALFRQQKRQNFPDKEVLSVYRDYGVVRKGSRTDNLNKTPDDLSSYQLVEQNDLVVNKMKGWQGSLGVSEFDGITSPDYMVFSPLHTEDSTFLHILLRSSPLVSTYRSISNGIRPAQWRLEPEQFLRTKIYLPPIEEQETIVSYCLHEIAKLDGLKAEAERAIMLLKERRTALIAAAVTGQIDVRQA